MILRVISAVLMTIHQALYRYSRLLTKLSMTTNQITFEVTYLTQPPLTATSGSLMSKLIQQFTLAMISSVATGPIMLLVTILANSTVSNLLVIGSSLKLSHFSEPNKYTISYYHISEPWGRP